VTAVEMVVVNIEVVVNVEVFVTVASVAE